jgi:hypothetical protein
MAFLLHISNFQMSEYVDTFITISNQFKKFPLQSVDSIINRLGVSKIDNTQSV